MRMQAVAKTHLGHIRQRNEDSYLVLNANEALLAMVSDGMGGAPAGDIASALVTDVFAENMDQLIAMPQTELSSKLEKLMAEAHERLVLAGYRSADLRGMGATATVAFISHRVLWFAHCGDSRLYVLRGKVLRQLTKDHNLPGSPHILNRVVGGQRQFDGADTGMINLERTDRVLLCTDGLYEAIGDAEVTDILGNKESIELQCDKLIARALEEGGKDNITALILG